MKKVFEIIGVIFVTIIILGAIALVMAFPTMWLWNWLMPVIFGLCKITFWQALGLNLLTGILFRSYNSLSKSE